MGLAEGIRCSRLAIAKGDLFLICDSRFAICPANGEERNERDEGKTDAIQVGDGVNYGRNIWGSK